MIYKRGGNSVEDKDLENDLEQKEESEEKEVQEETLQEEEEKKEEETSAKEEKEPAKENKLKRFGKKKDKTVEKTVIEKMLPVIDNFERGLAVIPEEEKEAPFVQGVELVYKQLVTALSELGVQPIEAVGKEFNPDFHNAVMAVDDDSLESGTVAEEMQKGYMYKESVVRHSMVKVVN